MFNRCNSLITIPDISKWKKNNKIIFDAKKDISSIDSISLQNVDKINPILSDSSSNKNSSKDKNENSSKDKNDDQSPNNIEDYNNFDNNAFEEDGYQKEELQEYYNNFYS